MDNQYGASAFDILASHTTGADFFALILLFLFFIIQSFYAKNKTLENLHYKSELPQHWIENGGNLYSIACWLVFVASLIFGLIGQWFFLVYVLISIIIYFLAIDAGKHKAHNVYIDVARSILMIDDNLTADEKIELEAQTNISFYEFKNKEKLFNKFN